MKSRQAQSVITELNESRKTLGGYVTATVTSATAYVNNHTATNHFYARQHLLLLINSYCTTPHPG